MRPFFYACLILILVPCCRGKKFDYATAYKFSTYPSTSKVRDTVQADTALSEYSFGLTSALPESPDDSEYQIEEKPVFEPVERRSSPSKLGNAREQRKAQKRAKKKEEKINKPTKLGLISLGFLLAGLVLLGIGANNPETSIAAWGLIMFIPALVFGLKGRKAKREMRRNQGLPYGDTGNVPSDLGAGCAAAILISMALFAAFTVLGLILILTGAVEI